MESKGRKANITMLSEWFDIEYYSAVKKNQPLTPKNNIGEPHQHNTEYKKSDPKQDIQYESIYIKF